MEVVTTTETFEALRAPLAQVVGVLGRTGGDVSALATEEWGLAISIDDRKQDVVELPLLRGVVLRAFDGAGFVEYATDGASRGELLRRARALGRGARKSPRPPPRGQGTFETVCAHDVDEGGMPEPELLGQGPTLRVVAFSWFNPSPLTGDFATEIRLGYERRRGRERPVRGGAVQGNLFEAFRRATFAREVDWLGSYYGPRGIRCEGLAVGEGSSAAAR